MKNVNYIIDIIYNEEFWSVFSPKVLPEVRHRVGGELFRHDEFKGSLGQVHTLLRS